MTGSLTKADRLPAGTLDSRPGNVLLVSRGVHAQAVFQPLLGAVDFHVSTANSAEALHHLRHDNSTDLVLVDATTGHYGALELGRRIKLDQNTCLLPVVILLSPDQAALRNVALRWGADDCLTMPDQDQELLHRCKNLIRSKRATDALENSEKVIFALARMIEGKDKYTQGHVERVSAYSVHLGQRVGLEDVDIVAVQKGGILHDVGKIAVPDAILNKPGALAEEEWEVVRRHPLVGYDLLFPLRTFGPVLPVVRWHHERPNGTGYPDGIGGDELPIVARIVAVADCFDALTTARPYRQELPAGRSLTILTEGATKGDFDHDVVAVLRELCSQGAAHLVEGTAEGAGLSASDAAAMLGRH